MGADELDELLTLYMETVEQQDEIIHRMSNLLKRYAVELNHLRTVTGCLALDNDLDIDTRIVDECLEQYKDGMEP